MRSGGVMRMWEHLFLRKNIKVSVKLAVLGTPSLTLSRPTLTSLPTPTISFQMMKTLHDKKFILRLKDLQN